MKKRSAAIAAILLAACVACGSGKSSGGASAQPSGAATAAAAQPVPNCNGQSPVWALPRLKVYLLPGDTHYGKTKHGKYLCLSQAQAEGYRSARGVTHRHHKRLFSV
jgi:hypothetical protein